MYEIGIFGQLSDIDRATLGQTIDDPAMIILAAALLECVGLLRSQRRLFLSYRRVESSAAAYA